MVSSTDTDKTRTSKIRYYCDAAFVSHRWWRRRAASHSDWSWQLETFSRQLFLEAKREKRDRPPKQNQRKATRTVALALLGLDDDCRPMTHTSGHSIRARIVIGAFYHLCSFVDSRLWTAQRGTVATSNQTYGHLLLMSKQESIQ